METELAAVKRDLEEMGVKVNQIHTLLTEARGAQKAVRWLVALSGSSVFVWVMTYYKAILTLFTTK